MRLIFVIICVVLTSCTSERSSEVISVQNDITAGSDNTSDEIPVDTRMIGQWIITHEAGFDEKREQKLEIWAKDRDYTQPQYRVRVGNGIFDVKIDGNNLSFTRIIYATAAGINFDSVEFDYTYTGTLTNGTITGKYEFLGKRVTIDGEEEHILPPFDAELFETDITWHARKISNKNSWD